MNEWKAKYNAVLSGITDERIVSNAAMLVNRGIEISKTTALPFREVMQEMLMTVSRLNALGLQPKRKLFELIEAKDIREGDNILFDEHGTTDTVLKFRYDYLNDDGIPYSVEFLYKEIQERLKDMPPVGDHWYGTFNLDEKFLREVK